MNHGLIWLLTFGGLLWMWVLSFSPVTAVFIILVVAGLSFKGL
jgi:hypothetical protein